MNPEMILKISKEIRNSKHPNKKLHFKIAHKEFANTYPLLFDMCCDDESDFAHLEYMIGMLQNIENNRTSAEVASVNVGQKMFDYFVKPLVDKEKEQNPE
jgi:hypothetical protein